jgi:hypothetical protein
MANELLPPEPPEPPPSSRRSAIVCEFCECKLTASGDILKMSDRAKALRKQEDTIDGLTADVQRLTSELAAVTRERDELKAKTAPARDDGLFS